MTIEFIRRRAVQLASLFVTAAWLASGCAKPADPHVMLDLRPFRERGFECIKRGVEYRYLPSVRAQAVEAMQRAAADDGRPWIRSALTDEHPAVRFAACLAAGSLQDALARDGVLKCLEDDNPSVRVGAIFALHRLGDTRYTAELPEYLLEHADPAVRRNAALVLGRLGEPGAIALLARAMSDKDEGVQLQALEAMALLGGHEAQQQLTFFANSGTGYKEVFALNALNETRDRRFADTFRYKLEHSEHLETRLAAARGLGAIGLHDGYRAALTALSFDRPKPGIKDDPPENQVRRIRGLAALAVGAIGDPAALPALDRLIETCDDANVQVAAGRALLEIVAAEAVRQAPFAQAAADQHPPRAR